MFPNLKAEMARYGLSYAQVAAAVGRNPAWLDAKLRGKGNISIQEALIIHDKFFPDMDYGYLFAGEPVTSVGAVKEANA